MAKTQMLRSLVNQRLTAAAEEIFELFERTIAEYEEERSRSKESQHQRQDAVINPEEELLRPDVQQLMVREEEVLPEQKVGNVGPTQEEPPESADIKEEQEELWSSQEREQLRGAEEDHVSMFTFTPVLVKSEEDDREKAQSLQLHENQSGEDRDTEHLKTEAGGADCGGSEADRDFNPDSHLEPVTPDKTPHLSGSDTDASGDWESDDPQEGLNPLPNQNVAVSGVKSNTGNTSVSSSDFAPSVRQRMHKEKPFSCSVCGKRYPGKKNLRKHMLRHSDEKPFSCSVCKKTFIKRTELVMHMRGHTGEKPYSCSVCGRRFSRSGHLKEHAFVHTGEKPFSCSICGKRFTQSGSLKRHAFVHTDEKPYSCSVCGKRFTQSGHLKSHSLVHVSDRTCNCSICDMLFSSGSSKTGYNAQHNRADFSHHAPVPKEVSKGPII